MFNASSASSSWASSVISTVPLSSDTPWYFTSRESLIPGLSDKTFNMFAPIVAYWTLSLFFHLLDNYSLSPPFTWMGVERYRIHESEEMKKRNKVTPGEVVRAVILQQVIQVALAVLWLTEDDVLHRESPEVAMTRLAPSVLAIARVLLGDITAARFMRAYGGQILYCVYWWIIPTVQFFFSCFVIDTWQYFLHRAMHVNKFLYRQFHSWHHRLYVPYAYGALYNHPVEGFILDSLGAVIAEALAGLSIRQSSLLFGFSAAKTVDDHCGFALPWDPLQFLYPNNARYHDIHHQHYGLKYNFSQPFWVHWDVIMGTRWDKPARPLAAEKRAALAEKNGPDSDVSSDSGIAMGSVNKED